MASFSASTRDGGSPRAVASGLEPMAPRWQLLEVVVDHCAMFKIRQDSTLRVRKAMIATRQRTPRRMGSRADERHRFERDGESDVCAPNLVRAIPPPQPPRSPPADLLADMDRSCGPSMVCRCWVSRSAPMSPPMSPHEGGSAGVSASRLRDGGCYAAARPSGAHRRTGSSGAARRCGASV